MLAAFPLPEADLWRVMAPAPPQVRDDPTHDEILDYLDSRLDAEASGTIRSAVWTSTFRIHHRLADTYRLGAYCWQATPRISTARSAARA